MTPDDIFTPLMLPIDIFVYIMFFHSAVQSNEITDTTLKSMVEEIINRQKLGKSFLREQILENIVLSYTSIYSMLMRYWTFPQVWVTRSSDLYVQNHSSK